MKRAADLVFHGITQGLVILSFGVLVIPILVTVFLSFDARDYMGPFPPPALSWQWYQRFFTEPSYLHGLYTSLGLASIATAISAVIGIAAASGLSRVHGRAQHVLTTLFLMPNALPHVVIGFALLLFFSAIGIFTGFGRLVAAHVLITIPYTIRVTYAGMAGLRPSYSEAALNLGATERQAFWEVIIPLVKTSILAGLVFAFTFSMDDVSVSLFLSDTNTYTLPVVMLGMMQTQIDLTIAVGAVLQCALALITLLVLDRLLGVERVFGIGVHQS